MAIQPIMTSGMLNLAGPSTRPLRQRADRRLRPTIDHGAEGIAQLEPRVLLSALAESPASAAHIAAQIQHLARKEIHHAKAAHPHKRLTPAQEVTAVYNAYTLAFANVLSLYVQSINQQTTNTVTVQATLTAPYATTSSTIQVNNASVFGPGGTFPTPVTAQAFLGTVSLGRRSCSGAAGNQLIVSNSSALLGDLPTGTVLTANVTASSQSSASSIFPNYITDSTIQMAIHLVEYFNSLPILLPLENAPPHTPDQRGAIQTFVYESITGATAQTFEQSVAGGSLTSLQQLLLAIPLPTTDGSDLQIYMQAVASAILESEQQLKNGITQIFNRKLLVNAASPANRLGESFNSSSSSGGSSSSGSTSSSSGSSSTST